jgi:phage/plasmid-associated DNA primase
VPDIKNKRELSQEAAVLAASFECVRYRGQTYLPTDYVTGDHSVIPPVDRKIWLPLTREDLQIKSQHQFDTLFQTDAELSNFEFMVAQCALPHPDPCSSIFIHTAEGLRELKDDGALYEPSGNFIANALKIPLNTDEQDKQELKNIFIGWLSSEEEASALLRHMATALAPGWSAVKYMLLLGDGRNGKSVLMSMMEALFGRANVSSVTRQDIADRSPVVTELNGKLLNIVYDGVASYLKDSGNEKSLIAGEPIGVRKLYSSELTRVQTNALFIEGLNKEPKSSDKSSALQARIIRFWFPNTYADDLEFRDRMLSEQMLGALLALLIDSFVKKQDKAVMLAPTSAAIELQMEYQLVNSAALQYLAWVEHTDPLGSDSIVGADADRLIASFQSWRVKEGDINHWSSPDVMELFRPMLNIERRSRRVGGKVTKVKVVTGFKRNAEQFIDHLRGEKHDDAMVED